MCTTTTYLELVSPPVVRPGTEVSLKAKIKNDCWFHPFHIYIYFDNEKKVDELRFYLAPGEFPENLTIKVPEDAEEGTHIITVRTSDEEIANQPGKSVEIFVGELKDEGILVVESDPSNAEVYLNNRFVGYTPKKLILKPGIYRVKVTKTGYQPVEKDVEVFAGQTTKVFAKLEPIAKASEPWIMALGAGILGIFTGIALKYVKERGYLEKAKPYVAKAREVVKRAVR